MVGLTQIQAQPDEASIQEKDVNEVYDIHGKPADKLHTGGWLAAGFILATEVAERICVMGITMNLVTYLTGTLHLPASKSATENTNFMGTLNLLALLVGFISDAKIGRFFTVIICNIITTLGMVLLIVATAMKSMRPPPCSNHDTDNCVQATGSQLSLLYVALYTVALGAGGIKSNVSTLGADQFDENDPKEKTAMIFFFNKFYFFVSLGSLFSVTVLVYIQDNVGRDWGYGIAAVTMVVAFVLLVVASPRYRLKRPQGSPLTVIIKTAHVAWRNRKLTLPSDPSSLNGYYTSMVPHTKRCRCLDKAAIMNSENKPISSRETSQTMNKVEDVKMVIKLLPIWSTCILFWTVYSQMSTFSVHQSKTMDRRLGPNFVIPPASMSFFLHSTILLFTSLNEKVLVPLGNKFIKRTNKNANGISSLERIGMGLCFSIVAMAAAAAVENKRRGDEVQGNNVSVFWLVPQYFLVGAGEAFVYVGQLEFFIREAPEGMKSMSLGLSQTALCMGYYVSSLLVFVVGKVSNGGWLKTDLNKGRLDYFYLLLGVLGVLNFFVFVWFARSHEFKELGNNKSHDSVMELELGNDNGVEKAAC